MEFLKKTLKNWLYVDTRTLALFRIVFGVVGLIDVLRRYGLIDVFYSDTGAPGAGPIYLNAAVGAPDRED